MASATSPLARRPYYGSCHCGYTRYVCYLTLLPAIIHPNAPTNNTRICKCNCTTCHKTSLFHVRLGDAPNDFILLSPTNPSAHWFFCGKCGVRCFVFGPGEQHGETVEIDLEGWLGRRSEGKSTKVWRPKKEAWAEDKDTYLSINAPSLDAGQEGLDLREWHEKGWIAYLDQLDQKENNRLDVPYRGGMY
ncbi:hypothetical protein K469DRAFT_731248 [Zopfia rhizophila CBS 207.26]|uniref:CENP-V/GFA domain-containing protein n=1 Tax=Zopfia rhizophila CBS 207.26 TaxID=1314779 RepID=A0A6A6ENH0_9PEZI|nr:hypothetical protein K469DRAFT_731248 [Zopfia rhizophila CBS 207.26]